MSNESLDEKKKRLVGEIENLRRKEERRRRTNGIIYSILILFGIGFAVGAALAGFIGDARIAGVMAVFTGALVSLESAFKFGEKRDFFRMLATEYYNLQIALRFRVETEQNFQLVLDKLRVVNATSARTMPRGEGMQAVKKLYDELDSRGILPVPETSSMG